MLRVMRGDLPFRPPCCRSHTRQRTARERGIIPWERVVDETRTIECEPAWDNPQEFVESITGQYRLI
jgi:hypothetical protein